jgi:hypothetical protein
MQKRNERKMETELGAPVSKKRRQSLPGMWDFLVIRWSALGDAIYGPVVVLKEELLRKQIPRQTLYKFSETYKDVLRCLHTKSNYQCDLRKTAVRTGHFCFNCMDTFGSCVW